WVDDQAETDDWIELVNAGAIAVELSSYFIEDGSETRVVLPELSLGPGQRIVVFADDSPEQGALHLPFKLSSDGDRIILRDETGVVVDDVEVPPLELNEVWVRIPDESATWRECRYATPGRGNGSDCAPPVPVVLDDEIEFAPFTLSDPYPAARSGLVVSELGLRPDETGDAFVEVYNAGPHVLSLAAYTHNLSTHKPHQAWPTP